MMWEVRLHPEVEAWFLDLCRTDSTTADLVAEAIFAFDPAREAVFLVAGDKSGRWQTWYRAAIPLA